MKMKVLSNLDSVEKIMITEGMIGVSSPQSSLRKTTAKQSLNR